MLVAIPGSFFLPLMIWTPLIMNLGAPDDADMILREKREEREGRSPRMPGGGSPRSRNSRPIGFGDGPVSLKCLRADKTPTDIRHLNPIHNLSMDSLSGAGVSSDPEQEAEDVARKLADINRMLSEDTGIESARSPGRSSGGADGNRVSFKPIKGTKESGLTQMLGSADALDW